MTKSIYESDAGVKQVKQAPLQFGCAPNCLFAELQARETWIYFLYCSSAAKMLLLWSQELYVLKPLPR